MGSKDGEDALENPEFWDHQYSKFDGKKPTHEWYRSFDDLVPWFEKNLFTIRKPAAEPLILHVGSGDSVIPAEFASRGYRNQICVDFSTVVVEYMTVRHAGINGIQWRYADVRNMVGFQDQSVDVAFDKGTLDAMIHGSPWNPPDDVKENTRKYISEVYRVLKDDGIFLCVSYRQPHFIQPRLNHDSVWHLDMEVLRDENSFDYYGYVLRKKPKLPPQNN